MHEDSQGKKDSSREHFLVHKNDSIDPCKLLTSQKDVIRAAILSLIFVHLCSSFSLCTSQLLFNTFSFDAVVKSVENVKSEAASGWKAPKFSRSYSSKLFVGGKFGAPDA